MAAAAKAIGSALKRALATPEAYAILDASAAGPCTFLAGGCAILADALAQILGGEIVAVYRADTRRIQHYVLRRGEHYLDGDGACLRATLLRRERTLEGIPQPRLAPPAGLIGDGIVRDAAASRALAALLAPVLAGAAQK